LENTTVKKNKSKTTSRNQRGMTAIELLIALAAVGLVILISVPGASMLIEHYRLKSTSSDLVSGLYLARAEAISRASTVRVCPSDDGTSCRTDGNWSTGWLVYTDGNGDGLVQDIELLEAFAAPNEHVHIVALGAAQKAAAFTPTGLVQNNGAAKGEFVLCYGENNSAKAILIDPDGWVSLIPTDGRVCRTG
jgi:type IV fimbrial biogenesis protein FimT